MAEDDRPDPEGDEEYGRWLGRVNDARRYAEEEFVHWADKVERYFRGQQWVGYASPSFEHLTVNMIYSTTKTIVPRLYFQNPKPIVTPLIDVMPDEGPDGEPINHDVVKNAEIMREVLAQKLKVIGYKQQKKRKIRNAYLHSGISKIGWGNQYGMPPNKPPRKWKAEAGEKEPLQFTPVTGRSVDVHPDQPWILNVHPRDVWLPPYARTYDDLDYIVHRVFRAVEDVKRDQRYRNTEDLSGTRHVMNSDAEKYNAKHQQKEDFVELFEAHYRTSDKSGNAVYRMKVMAEGHRGFLFDGEDAISNVLGRYCFRFLCFSEDPDRIYGRGDMYQVLPIQDEINKLRSTGLEVVKRQPTGYVTAAQAFDEKEMEKLMSAEPQKIVKSQVGDARSAIAPMEAAPLTQDFYMYQGRMADDYREVSGVGANQQGVGGMATATEASIVQSNVDVRTAEMIDAVKDDTIGDLEDLAALLMRFADKREIVRVAGRKGIAWETWDKDAIVGKYEYDIDVTSMLPPNSPVKKKLALDLLNVAMTQPQLFNLPKIAKAVLGTMQDTFPNPEEFLRENEEPDQDAETLAMLSGEPAETQPWFDHAAHLQKLGAFQQSLAHQNLLPEVQQLLLEHGQGHQSYLDQASGKQRGLNQPGQGAGMVPAMMATRTPTESSIAAGAVGGRPVGAF